MDSIDTNSLMYQDIALDPNINYNILEEIISKALNNHIPLKKVKFHKYKNKRSNWITTGIIKSIKFRDNLYKTVKQTPQNTVNYFNLKQNLAVYNKILKRLIKDAKIRFYSSKFNKYRSDSKMTWNTINDILNRSKFEKQPDYMTIDDCQITDKGSIANHFNNYFGQIGTSMANSIPLVTDQTFTDYLKPEVDTLFIFEKVSVDKVKNIILGLKTKSSFGHDSISNSLLKHLEPLLSKPLALIINQSLAMGIFPDKLKIAKVIPIHKKNDIHLMENYRPISILPSISKVFERVVHEQIYSYFLNNNLLSSSQYGFRKQHSTEHAVLEVVDRVASGLEKGNTPIAIFLDLSKAFDTLNYDILLTKLDYYGIKCSALNWFRSYFTNRLHYVEYDDIKSNKISISLGVPQGSILGPLLFTLYINDIQNSTDYFSFIKYADDTNLFNPMNVQDFNVINLELNKVYNWLCVNRLSLNEKKTKFMIFHNQNKTIDTAISGKLLERPIERVSNFNFLGVILNENLKWNTHMDSVCNRILRSIGIFCNLRHYLPTYILKTLYNSLVLSHCTYGILAWGTHNTRLYKIQKKAIRVISNSKFYAHTEPLFKRLGLLKLDDLFKLNILKFYYLHFHNLLPHYLQQFEFKARYEIHDYKTRNKFELNLQKNTIKAAENSLRHVTPKIINDTPSIITDKIRTHSLQGFTSYIKQHFINSYTYDCNILDCFVCRNAE